MTTLTPAESARLSDFLHRGLSYRMALALADTATLDDVSLLDGVYDLERDFGAPTDGTKDATAAVQAAVDAIIATGKSGRLICNSRTYAITNVNFPVIGRGTQQTITIEIIGLPSLAMVPWAPGFGDTNPAPVGGTIFKSSATSGAAFGVPGGAVTNIHLAMRNVIVRCPNNPACSGIDGGWLLNMELENVWVDTGAETGFATQLQPTHGTIGVNWPGEGNGGHVLVKGLVSVSGFAFGMRHSEHLVFENITIFKCGVAFQPSDGWHAAVGKRLSLYWNTIDLQPNVYDSSHPTTRLAVEELDTEESVTSTDWFYTTAHIDDPGNRLRGDITYHRMIPGQGVTDQLRRNGAAYLNLHALGFPPDQLIDSIGFEGADSTTALPNSQAGMPAQQFRGTFGVIGRRAYIATVSNGDSLCGWEAGTPNVLLHSKLIATSTAAVLNTGFAINVLDANNHWMVLFSNTVVSIMKYEAGVYTTPTGPGNALPFAWAAGAAHDVKIRVRGRWIIVFVDGVQVAYYQMTTAEWTKYSPATVHGFAAYDAGYENGGSRWGFLKIYRG